MPPNRRRLFILILILLVDFAGLSVASILVLKRPMGDHSAVARQVTDSNSIAESLPPTSVVAAPSRAGSGADVQLKGSPKFILSGTSDRLSNGWFGTEEQGVFEYSNRRWTQFTSAEGLGDDDVTALACDTLGRVWAGHLDHGVSVYNGSSWKNYDRAAGCGGSHVRCISICPTDGDVWIATEAGLTRYSLKNDSWSYYDRSTGMPDDQASSIAFDSQGNLFAGLQCSGIAIAHPSDGYSRWTQILGPDETPIRASGSGLASSLVNAMLVTRDDTVYAGTCRGLACSTDHGMTWAYVRGKNWPQLAQGRYEGMPDVFDVVGHAPLSEDWITTLLEDPSGMIWIGYQNAGDQTFMPDGKTADRAVDKGFVTTIVPMGDGHCAAGTYGVGAWERGTEYTGPAAPVTNPSSALPADAFPTPAAAPDAAALDAMRGKIESLPAASNSVAFLPDDWDTGGDWIGLYGSQFAYLLGYNQVHASAGYHLSTSTGPYRQAIWRYYWEGFNVPIERIRYLIDPDKKKRLFGEFNDESYDIKTHPRVQEGPDLYLRITVPQGVHVVSLYFHNHDAHGTGFGKSGVSGQRDFVLQIKNTGSGDDGYDDDESSDSNRLSPSDSLEAELSPTLARSRVSSFYEGVYKRLLIRTAGTYWIKINRNHSPAAKVSGVFIDRIDSPAGNNNSPPWFGPAFAAPAATDYSTDPGIKGAAARLWAVADAAVGREGYAALASRARLMAYRAAVAGGMDESTLANWRQKLAMWNTVDREQFDQAAGITAPAGL